MFFLIFDLEYLRIVKAASYKNESNLLLVGMRVCLESFLPIGCRTFIC